LIGGGRVEETEMNIEADTGSSEIQQTDFLPSVSAIVTLYTNVNLRLGYGETIARPSFREKAPIGNFLPDYRVTAFGNPDLEITSIESYDARLEWFPAPGDVLSAGVFYKELDKPIELYSRTFGDDVVTWINRSNGTAKVMGVEFEARKSMEFVASELKGLTIGANVTLIESEVTLTDSELINKRRVDPGTDSKRPLYDQSPYIINLDLIYAHPTSGTTLAIGANITGERLVIGKSQGPDIYEHPPITFDVGISQKFWKRWTARFAVRNILDPEFRQTYDSDYNSLIYQAYRRGRTFSFSIVGEW
jgi:TonB-dependent receptor